MNTPTHPPHIELAGNGLAAKCKHCGKGWAYDTSNPISTDSIRLLIKNFITKHIDCVPRGTDAVDVVRNTGDVRTAEAFGKAFKPKED